MKRREFVERGIGGALGAMATGSASLARAGGAPAIAAQRGSQRPNILFIIVHDLGTALNCYGQPNVKSPRLDQFASEGARLANYFCCSTPCSPSRGCIMTGRYAHATGLIGLANRGWSLPEAERTIVDYLNEAGYETVNIGGQHERIPARGNSNRFGQVGPARRNADLVAEDVCRFLKNWKRTSGPLYLNIYIQDVHEPWNRPEFQGRYAPDEIVPPPFLPNTAHHRTRLAQFYGSVSFMDEAMGRILDMLRQTGMEQDTLVIFTTDHGVSFPRAKSTLYDPGLRTALLVRWPGRIKPGSVDASLLGNVDLVPTLLDLAKLPIAKEIHGRSFAPLLLGGKHVPDEQIFAERNFHDDYDPMRCVRTGRYKLIRNVARRDRYMLPSEATERDTWATMQKSGKPRPFEELYDLEKDPNEFRDVAGDAAYAPVLADMRHRLDAWMNATADFIRGAKEFVYWPDGIPQP
jgi:N-sulfoglucosamine sulfohydrolase